MGKCIVCGTTKEGDYCPKCGMKTRTIGDTKLPKISELPKMMPRDFTPRFEQVEKIEVPKEEVEQEMREHPWASKEIAERIAFEHRKARKAEYWIELMEKVIFEPGLSRVERARRSLNLIYQSVEYLELPEFTKWVKRWRELTAPFAALELE